MKTVQRALWSEAGFPILTLLVSVSGLTVMWLANYAREVAPAWHGPMFVFHLMIIGLALRDLARYRRTRSAQAASARRTGEST